MLLRIVMVAAPSRRFIIVGAGQQRLIEIRVIIAVKPHNAAYSASATALHRSILFHGDLWFYLLWEKDVRETQGSYDKL